MDFLAIIGLLILGYIVSTSFWEPYDLVKTKRGIYPKVSGSGEKWFWQILWALFILFLILSL
tara:strand:+ start:1110 stop:1295 length:186 start_codon:yes stop_codon:yes gene_type:complete